MVHLRYLASPSVFVEAIYNYFLSYIPVPLVLVNFMSKSKCFHDSLFTIALIAFQRKTQVQNSQSRIFTYYIFFRERYMCTILYSILLLELSLWFTSGLL